ncbi:MAG: alpha/beta hydrolase [Elainella sp.]
MHHNISLSLVNLLCGTVLLTGCPQQSVKSVASAQTAAQTAAQSAQTPPASGTPIAHAALPRQNSVLANPPIRPLASLSPVHSSSPAAPVDLSPASPTAIDQISEQIISYSSATLGATRSYGLILPPNYSQQSSRRYPVIFLLHGGHGDQTDWLNPQKGDALATLKQLYKTNKLPPSIVITPDGNDHRGTSPYWDPSILMVPTARFQRL